MTDFRSVQRELAAYIRDPAAHRGPDGIEARRLAIYRDLFFRNIEGFLSSGFPVLRSLYAEESWHALVRDFMIRHRCRSPYFLKIVEEFLAYLENERGDRADDPPFLFELAHYEWVELALDVSDETPDLPGIDPDGDLLEGVPALSPLAWSLAYRFPVHRIGTAYRPAEPPEQPTFIVVYRNREEAVGFLEINAVTARLIELLQEDDAQTGRQLLHRIAEEIRHPQPGALVEHGSELLGRLRGLDILLGTVDACRQ